MERVKIEQHSFGGFLWCFGWLFTIGFLNLTFWKGAAALFIWPVYIGYAISPLLNHVVRAAH